MFKIEDFNKNLLFDGEGFWRAEVTNGISYPEGGNELCAEIEEHSFWFRHRNNIITTLVKNFPPSGSIFDIGGGNGFVSKGLMEAGFECVLIEPGINGARKAVERGVKNVICATIESIGIEKHSIPSAGLFDVIEHIEDDISFLKNLQSLLVPGGRLYATVPAYNFLWSSEDVQAGHYRRYTINSISGVLKEAGFQVEYATYFFSFLPPGIFFFRSLPSLLGRKKAASVQTAEKTHQLKNSLGGRIINRLLDGEIKTIRRRKQILFGGSCLVVAKG